MNQKKIEKAKRQDQKKREADMLKAMRKKSFFGFGKHYDPEDSRIMVMTNMPDGSTRRGINFGHPLVGRVFYLFILIVIGLGFWLSVDLSHN